MSALIVFLPPQPLTASTEFEYALTKDGSTVESHGAAQAALLPLPARAGTEVVALVPAAMLSWHRVELPKGVSAKSPRLRAMLEGVLEDQLLDEPEALHFALQPQAKGAEALWVATCDRAWLRSAMQLLESAQRPASRIVPEFAPEGSPALYAIGDARQPMLVLTGSEGVTALPLSPTALALLPSVSEETPCVAEPQVAALAEQVLHRQPLIQQAAARWLQAARSSWDLAQFEFSSSDRARAFKKLGIVWADVISAAQWRPARWGALALVAINLLGLNAWAWRERAVLDGKRETIRQTLTQTFPAVKVVVDAPLQMEKEVAALRQVAGATSNRDLEAMLGALSATPAGQHSINAIEFSPGELRVKGLALPPAQFQATATSLKSQGYTGQLQGDAVVITPESLP